MASSAESVLANRARGSLVPPTFLYGVSLFELVIVAAFAGAVLPAARISRASCRSAES